MIQLLFSSILPIAALSFVVSLIRAAEPMLRGFMRRCY